MSKILNDEEEIKVSNEIKNQFDAIDASTNENSGSLGLSLERKEVPSLSDDELANIAKDSLSDYYSSGVSSLLDSNEKSTQSLNSKAQKALENFENEKESLEVQVENAKRKASNQALKRGLARSSVIMNQLENYDKIKIEQTAKMEQDLNKQISQINYEIESLSSRLDDSLKAFDLSYAVKLQNKINDLKEEQTQKIEKALEYNNKIALQEAEFNAKYNDKLNSTSVSVDNTKAKYEVARTYFASLSKEDALSQLLNTDADYFRQHLGNYYFKLYNEIKGR